MNEFITKYLKPIKAFWVKLSKKLKIIVLSCIGGVIVFSIAIAVILGRPQYETLYSNISSADSRQVLAVLGENNTDYKIEQSGETVTILVDKKQEKSIRAKLAVSGYPKVVPNYDTFINNVDFMTTESEKRRFELFGMQERMQDSIKTIQGITGAIVTITPPEEDIYPWETTSYTPTASVVVTVSPGVTLEPQQVSGIKVIVSGANIGLLPENISVVDSISGTELHSSDDMSYVDISQFKLDIEKKVEEGIRANILRSIAPIYGAENITVSAKSSMNLDKSIKEIISHTPSTDDDKGIIEKSETNKEQIVQGEPNGGVAGAEENTDPPNYAGVTVDDNTIAYKDYENYTYAVNKTTEQITSDAAYLEDLSVSVAINRNARTLSADDISGVTTAIANAAGVSPAKVSVLNTEFLQLDEVLPKEGLLENKWLLISVSAAAVLLLTILVVVFVLNKRAKKKRLAQDEVNALANSAVVIPVGDTPNMEEDLKNTPESREHVLRKEIQDFSTKNPQIVAQLIKTWLRGDEE